MAIMLDDKTKDIILAIRQWEKEWDKPPAERNPDILKRLAANEFILTIIDNLNFSEECGDFSPEKISRYQRHHIFDRLVAYVASGETYHKQSDTSTAAYRPFESLSDINDTWAMYKDQLELGPTPTEILREERPKARDLLLDYRNGKISKKELLNRWPKNIFDRPLQKIAEGLEKMLPSRKLANPAKPDTWRMKMIDNCIRYLETDNVQIKMEDPKLGCIISVLILVMAIVPLFWLLHAAKFSAVALYAYLIPTIVIPALVVRICALDMRYWFYKTGQRWPFS